MWPVLGTSEEDTNYGLELTNFLPVYHGREVAVTLPPKTVTVAKRVLRVK